MGFTRACLSAVRRPLSSISRRCPLAESKQQFHSPPASEKVDLRSDTITLPSERMRRAMANAKVGDDVFGEDPTVKELERAGAELMGKEAAIFVPSGGMANLIGIGVHCQGGRGEELICGRDSHVYLWEGGAASAFLGVSYMCLPNQLDGTISVDHLEASIRPIDAHCPRSTLLCLENTHNMRGGRALTKEYTEQVSETARELGLKVHIDGARILNSSVALGVSPADLAAPADTVSVCLSKGLGAPVGSLLVGAESHMAHARYLRKALGGGWRQAGVIAAAGLESLNNVERLQEDHRNAKLLAEGLARIPGIVLDPAAVHTNIVYFDVCRESMSPSALAGTLEKRHGVLIGAHYGPSTCRAVTHLDVSTAMTEAAVKAVRDVMESTQR